MPGLRKAEMPADIAEIVDAVADFLGLEPEDLFVADADHEGLRDGAYSIAHEGSGIDAWPYKFTGAVFDHDVPLPVSWHLEAGGCYLACYPAAD